jgi:hypothetical protein
MTSASSGHVPNSNVFLYTVLDGSSCIASTVQRGQLTSHNSQKNSIIGAVFAFATAPHPPNVPRHQVSIPESAYQMFRIIPPINDPTNNLLHLLEALLCRLLSVVGDVGVLEGTVPRVVSSAHLVWFAAGINRAMQLSLRLQSSSNISGILVARLIGLGHWRSEAISVCDDSLVGHHA